jgi:serine/threonine-protein kinase SRPK3
MSSEEKHFRTPGLKDIENVEQYVEGGLHPVHLGEEVANGRYRIVHKLGYGTSSTIWLARDYFQERYVALKFLTAAESRDYHEVAIHDHLSKFLMHQPGEGSPTQHTRHPGQNYLSYLLTDFKVKGPNGDHRCLVFDVEGPSMHNLVTNGGTIPVMGSRRLAGQYAREMGFQLAQAIEFLHNNDIVHAGKFRMRVVETAETDPC